MSDLTPKKQTVSDACQILAGAGLAELFTGHVSATTNDGRFLIPAHLHGMGRGMESITASEVFEVDANGEPLTADAPEPPEEVVIHASVLAEREDVTSVAHAHPTYATGLSAAQEELEPTTLDGMLFNGSVPVHDPGPKLLYSEADGQALVDSLGDKGAVLIRGHGAVTVGETVTESTVLMWLLERAAQLQTIAEQSGGAQPFTGNPDPGFLRGETEKPFEAAFEFLKRRHVD